jgi:hypothetical protein
MPTIFDTLVTKENDHTNLLRSVIERHPRVSSAALSYLFGRPITEEEASSCTVRLQTLYVGENGREIPDIVIEGPALHGLIEVKVDPALELTAAQEAGYQNCFPSSGERHLTFLVPNQWKHGSRVEEVRLVVAEQLQVRVVYWRELIQQIAEALESINDVVITEAVQFWKWRFGVTEMTSEERNSLSTWSKETYGAFRKLEKVITQTKALFDARGSQTELETSDTTAYGFYIKRDRLYLLWIGIWTKSPAPFCFGYQVFKNGWLRPLALPPGSILTGDHHLWQLGPETWEDPEKAYEAIDCFIKANYP